MKDTMWLIVGLFGLAYFADCFSEEEPSVEAVAADVANDVVQPLRAEVYELKSTIEELELQISSLESEVESHDTQLLFCNCD